MVCGWGQSLGVCKGQEKGPCLCMPHATCLMPQDMLAMLQMCGITQPPELQACKMVEAQER